MGGCVDDAGVLYTGVVVVEDVDFKDVVIGDVYEFVCGWCFGFMVDCVAFVVELLSDEVHLLVDEVLG